MIEPIIITEGMSISFGATPVLEDVTFLVPRGSIFGFIGPSGSGKTTTVRLLTGFYKPNRGRVSVLGEHPLSFSAQTRRRIGYMPQQFALYPDLTVWENMHFAASIYAMPFKREERLNDLLNFVQLDEHRRKLARNLSGGMKRRLSLAATLVHQPELVFLDEPTAGIDPVLRRKFWDHFQDLQTEDSTLFITTQYVNEASYCDYVGVMMDGRLLMVETPDGLRRRAYGGDMVDLRVQQELSYQDIQWLSQLALVVKEPTRLGSHSVRIVVQNASLAIPALFDWCQHNGITVETLDEFVPLYDDVFVEIIKNHRKTMGMGDGKLTP